MQPSLLHTNPWVHPPHKPPSLALVEHCNVLIAADAQHLDDVRGLCMKEVPMDIFEWDIVMRHEMPTSLICRRTVTQLLRSGVGNGHVLSTVKLGSLSYDFSSRSMLVSTSL